MESFYLDNGIKIIYEGRDTSLVSFSIAIDAGAQVENIKGLAHATEHMIFTGTKKRDEREINALFDKYFGFYNAMTNYPYVVYYGSTIKEDIEKGFELYTDVLINPSFKEKYFIKEMEVIKAELKEHTEDKIQRCEDELFFNAFENRRIKEPIIGNYRSLKEITIKDICEFYQEHYNPKNTVVSFIGGISIEEVKGLCIKYLGNWKKDGFYQHKENYEKNKKEVFIKKEKGGNLQYIFPIDHLNQREIKGLRILCEYIGGSTSSLLYEELRTKKGLLYDINVTLRNERDIKLFIIRTSSFDKNIQKIKVHTDEILKKLMYNLNINKDEIKTISKRVKTRVELFIEKSVSLAKEVSTYEIMYKDYNIFLEQFNNLEKVEPKEIQDIAMKVFCLPSVQIIAEY